MDCGRGQDESTRRFFEGAKGGLDDLIGDRLTGLKQELPRFLEGAKQGLSVLGPVVAELDRHLARRFSAFAYIDLDENLMSRVLADLLRSDSEHGQGDLFVSALLKHLREDKATQSGMARILPDGSAWSQVRVVREALTTHIAAWHRRIDVEISMSVDEERVAIAIENKPRAEDQPAQLDAYAEHLKRKYGGGYLLLYLTPEGAEPSEDSLLPKRRAELGNHFACASLVEWVNGWLQEAETQVKASYVQRFVADFRQAVLRKYTDSKAGPSQIALRE